MSTLFPELAGGGPPDAGDSAAGERRGPTSAAGEETDRDGAASRGAADRSRDSRHAGPLMMVTIRLGAADQALCGGPWALERWSKLLGADAAAIAIEAARVRLGDGQIELGFTGRAIGELSLRLLPCKPTHEHPNNFVVGLDGPVPNEAVRRLLEHTAARLRPARYRTLLKIFQLDPDRRLEQVPRARAGGCVDCSEPKFLRSVVRTPHGTDSWRIFFAELEQQRNFNHHLAGNILVVKHEDLECSYATPSLDDGTVGFFHYSALHAQPAAPGPRQRGPQGRRRPRFGDVGTDLQDLDVIKGGCLRLERVLDAVAELPHTPELVLVKTACVPKLISDDAADTLARFEARSGIPTSFLDNLADDRNDFFSSLLERLRRTPEFREPEQRQGRINLVGFPQVPEMERLVHMLSQLEIAVNARLVPKLRLDDIEHATWAELQVFWDCQLYQSSFELLLGNLDIRALHTVPPYGVKGTRAWLTSVAAALGREDRLATYWDAEWQPLASTWARLTAEARSETLGFVLDRHAAELLLHPARGTGIPILAMLQEMGFELELLYYAGDGSAPPSELAAKALTFHDQAGLEALLRRSEARAFYSEYAQDRRLSRTGKAQFSIRDFALGIGGAVATLDRLLRICALPFYRRYGRYLGQAFASSTRTGDS